MWRLLVVVAACSSSPPVARSAFDPAANLAIASEDVEFAAGANRVPGTLVHPTGHARYPGIVMMEGSAPADRDWERVHTGHGIGKELAEVLAHRGAVVLRFDKAGVAANKTQLAGQTFDLYRAEGRAAFATLRARTDVDPDKLFVIGHSEGAMHAMRVALAEGPPLAGLIMLSGGGRRFGDIQVAQIESQLHGDVHAQSAPLRAAIEDFIAGKPADPMLMSVHADNVEVQRGILSFDPATAIADVAIPIFIYNGQRDIQIDPERDAQLLERRAKAAGRNVTLFLAPEADHVLMHETRTMAELTGQFWTIVQHYNDLGRTLDPASIDAIARWIAAH